MAIINWGCTKLDTTTIGSDLLPEVDNVNTFADTLDINTTQAAFNDTTKLLLSENFVVGTTNDPLFGSTDATLFLQLKPGFYPYYIGAPRDTLVAYDSVVLCLSYKGAYGDTSLSAPLIKLQVFPVLSSQHGEWDSLAGSYSKNINYEPAYDLANPLSGEVPVFPSSLGTYKVISKGKDSVINQIRIRLNSNFATALMTEDSLAGGAFSRDTLFRAFNNGFAVRMTSGNALLYTELTDANTRLELHYKRKVYPSGIRDTSFSVFTFNSGAGGSSAPRRSQAGNKVVRNRPGLSTGDQEIMMQTSPGTYASLKIPELTGYSNRIIHRAELVMDQIPDPATDSKFVVPNYLYLDLVDTGSVLKWKPIYYDLNPSSPYDPDHTSGSAGLFDYYPANYELDFAYFGGIPKKTPDGSRYRYTFNISRYIQRMVINQSANYELRLFAPQSIIYPQYNPTIIPYANNLAYGRVRLAGGNYPDINYRMRLRIIYSKAN